MPNSLAQRSLAEAVGTMLLVATVVGSGIMATNLTKDIALQLLCNSLATGAVLVVLITIFAPVSGAHFNPAVSLVFTLKGDLNPKTLLVYCGAQFAGGIAGTVIAHLMFGLPIFDIGGSSRSGSTLWFSEVIATFLLITTILGTIKSRKEAVSVNVGLVIIAAYWFTSSTSFANPAVTLARGFTASFSGIAFSDVPMFVIMQVVGSLAGLAFSKFVFGSGKV